MVDVLVRNNVCSALVGETTQRRLGVVKRGFEQDHSYSRTNAQTDDLTDLKCDFKENSDDGISLGNLYTTARPFAQM